MKEMKEKKIFKAIVAFILIGALLSPSISALPGVWTEQAKLIAEPGSWDLMGESVAIDGEYAIIGGTADGGIGKVYVFKRTGTSWAEETKLTASDNGLYFGRSVAIDGEYAIVGAPYSQVNYFGAAYIFKRTGTSWVEQAKLAISDGAAWDCLGLSVSISGDSALVGCHAKDDYAGAAYVFTRTGSSWTEQAKLTASDGVPDDCLGASVSIDGDSAIIGASSYASSTGAAYVFTRTGSIWTEQAKLTASDGTIDDKFGRSVSIDGDSAIAGAPSQWEDQVGAAYIFKRTGASWAEEAKLTASDGTNNDWVGYSVSISGDGAIAGAGANSFNAAYVFKRNGTSWAEEDKLTPSDADYEFGCAVAIDNNYAIVGDFSGEDWDGAAYIFTKPMTIVSIDPPSQMVEKGETFMVSVLVEPIEPIMGASFANLFFDASLIQADLVTESDLFDSYIMFDPGTIDNVNGKITDVFLVADPSDAVNESGNFVDITFTALDTFGTSELDLDGVEIPDIGGNPLMLGVTDGEVIITTMFTLDTNVIGCGDIELDPPGGTYPVGTSVELTAVPCACWEFTEWSGDLTGSTNPDTIVMDGNKTVTAIFDEIIYDLTINVGGCGTTTPAEGVHSFACGTVVDLEAFPCSCHEFAGWTIGEFSTWTQIIYSGTGEWIQMSYSDAGYMPPSGAGAYFAGCDSDMYSSLVYDCGLFTPSLDLTGETSVSLDFEKSFQCYETDWGEVNTYSDGVFEENLATYTSYQGGHETLVFDPSGYTDPSDVTIEFYYSTGGETYQYLFKIDDVTVTPGDLSEGFEGETFPPVIEPIHTMDNPTTITMDDDKTVTATFTEIFYDLTILVDGNGTTDPIPGVHSIACGTVVPVEAFADPNWAFTEWTGDLISTDNPETILMDDDKTITAVFKQGWTSTLTLDAEISSNNIDTVIFGESAIASDGIDDMDLPKPGPPPAPFIYACLMTDLEEPYDVLWHDFRFYPADDQVWDLDVETEGIGEFTTVTLNWNIADILMSGYDNVGLFDEQSQQFVADMKTESTYAYVSDHGMIYHFQIRCSNNHPPVANDDFYTTNENTQLTVVAPGVLLNDNDPDGDPIEVTGITSGPSDGMANILADGSFDYTPDVGFTGTDSFVYEITDGEFFDTATVTIDVIALNRIHIQDRWNLISMPVGEDIDKTTIIVEYDAAFHTWQEAINDGVILGFTYGWQGGIYNDEQILVPGEGFWLWAYEDCDLLIPSNVPGDNHITFLDVEWNLVGIPYAFNLDKTQVNIEFQEQWLPWDDAVLADIILDFVYDWDRTNQFYVISDDPDTFVSGFGYWVYAYQSCAMKKV